MQFLSFFLAIFFCTPLPNVGPHTRVDLVRPTPTICVSSTTICVSSDSCVPSEKVSGVPISCGHASEADTTLPLDALLRRPVLISGTMLAVIQWRC